MTAADRLGLAPLLPPWAMIALALLAGFAAIVYLARGGRSPILRGLGIALLLAALAQPMRVRELREPAADIVALIIDQSESLSLSGRLDAARRAGEAIAARLGADPSLEVRVREARGGPDGTAITAALESALADAPRERIAGAIVISDGQASDPPADPKRLAPLGPVHLLLIGDPNRGDRRLELLSEPTFAIVGEPLTVAAIIHDPGQGAGGSARVQASVNGRLRAQRFVPLNQAFDLQVEGLARGENLLTLEVAPGDAEISLANNRAAISLRGVRDRLRVLLVTGEPYPGARVWRNLLKSDPAVDLVHFTILRPLENPDPTPIDELALIQFPTEELFVEKLDEFDLIIFDRYRQRGILPSAYFDNIVRRIRRGGALLIVAGPADASWESVYRTPLAEILPAAPTERVIEQAFRPSPTALGARHPVLAGLPDPGGWGRWTRVVEARANAGQVILDDGRGRPILTLDRVGEGRVAQLWSDQAWLWARGHDGGGPHADLLRRVTHWLMGEPELDEERLSLAAGPDGLVAEFASLGAAPAKLTLTPPEGAPESLPLTPTGEGRWRGVRAAPADGLWSAEAAGKRAFAAVGPLNPKEAAALTADAEILRPLAAAARGAVRLLGEDGATLPEIRRIGANENPAREGGIGLVRRGAYTVRTTTAEPLVPGVVFAALALGLFMAAWLRETR